MGIQSPEHVRIINEESPPDSKMLKPNANCISPISPLKESVIVEKKSLRKPMTFRGKKSLDIDLDTSV